MGTTATQPFDVESQRHLRPRHVLGPQWYAARVQPQQELSVARRLGTTCTTYAPQFVMDGKPWGPVFRSYVFFEFDMVDDSWVAINNDRHVVKLLPLHRTYPVEINREMIEWCKEREQAGDFLLRSRLTLSYKKGDQVRIHYGPMTGMRGSFVKQQGSAARVMMTIFNALREMTIPVAHLLEPS